MSSHPIPIETSTSPIQPVPRHVQAVQELLEIGMELMQLVRQQAKVEVEAAARLNEPTPDFTIPFERMSRSIRRTALLVDKFVQPAKAPAAVPAMARKEADRKEIIRAVEDSIDNDAPEGEAESLQAEFMERLDRPDIEDDIGDRPVEEIITDIRRDLGVAGAPGLRPWKRRTPDDVALLCARAAVPRPAAGPFVLPMPPRQWTPAVPLFPPPEMGLGSWPGDERIRGP